MLGSVRVDPNGRTLSVNFLTSGGAQAAAFLDDGSGVPAALPSNISSPTTFYLGTGGYQLSATYNGLEIAGGAGNTRPFEIREYAGFGVTLDVDAGAERAAQEGLLLTASQAKATYVPLPVAAEVNPLTGMVHVVAEDGVTDYSTRIQAALDAAGGLPVYFGLAPAGGSFDFATTLKLNTNQNVQAGTIGAAVGDLNPTTLRYIGPDATNGIEVKQPGVTSRFSLEGIRLTDGRVGATSGTGIYIEGAKNLLRMKTLNVFGFPTDGIYLGKGSTATSVENIDLENIWVNAGRYGINIDALDNACRLAGIYGDSVDFVTPQMDALINLDSVNGGQGVVTITGAKCETNTGCHVLRIGPSFLGAVDGAGLVMRGPSGGVSGTGGDVVHILNNNALTVIHLTALGSVATADNLPVATNMVNDVENGKTYGAGSRRLALWVRENNKVVNYRDLLDDLATKPVFLPAEAISLQGGTPSLGLVGSRYAAWLMDASATEGVAAAWVMPSDWTTANIDLYWSHNDAVATGDVRWQVTRDTAAEGGSLAVSGTATAVTASAPSQHLLKITRLGTGIALVPGQLYSLRINRIASDVADTFTADAGVIGLRITRAS